MRWRNADREAVLNVKKWSGGRLRGKREGLFEETEERLPHIWFAKQLKWMMSGGKKALSLKIYTSTGR